MWQANYGGALQGNTALSMNLSRQLERLGERLGLGWRETLELIGQRAAQAIQQGKQAEYQSGVNKARELESLGEGLGKGIEGLPGGYLKTKIADRQLDIAQQGADDRSRQIDEMTSIHAQTEGRMQDQFDWNKQRDAADRAGELLGGLKDLIGDAGSGLRRWGSDAIRQGGLDRRARMGMEADAYEDLGDEISDVDELLTKRVQEKNTPADPDQPTTFSYSSPYSEDERAGFTKRREDLVGRRQRLGGGLGLGGPQAATGAGGGMGEALASSERLDAKLWQGTAPLPHVQRIEAASGLSDHDLNDLFYKHREVGLSRGTPMTMILLSYLRDLEQMGLTRAPGGG